MSAAVTNLGAKKEPRALEVIQQEYNNLAFKSGNLQYELVCKHKDLDALNDQMRELNFEYIAAKNKEEADKKAQSEQPKEEGLKNA